MELTEFLQALLEHNKAGKGYQIQLNSGNLDDRSTKNTDIEIGDLYFTECSILQDTEILCFGNVRRKPIGQAEDGTNLYPQEINSQIFINVDKIEAIEDIKDFQDWFEFSSDKVINVYMYPDNDSISGNRNVVTIGFMR